MMKPSRITDVFASARWNLRVFLTMAAALFLLTRLAPAALGADGKPVRILFLGHDSEHHNSNEYYPMIAAALGREAIYFDYSTDLATALDPEYLRRFDGLLLYANHTEISPGQLQTLIDYVEAGHGFIPVHSASACFGSEKRFVDLVGARFSRHGGEVFRAGIVRPNHPAMAGVTAFETWDETYVHTDHHESGRTVLMVRVPAEAEGDRAEPWTWVRRQGKGRVFYTASGHDARTWSNTGFQQMLKAGILWAIGDEARSDYERFITTRKPLQYEKRDHIPNYERRPEPLPYQLPLSPEDSLDYTQVPVEFDIDLFAAEPDIVNPIWIAWDERGRLWAAETVDYPNEVTAGGGRDRIKILEDTNGDGRCDKVTVFADGLNIPTSFTFSNGGVIVAHAPDFLFLKDIDGDDRADSREVLFTGWGTSDTHAGPSNLRYGIDNWLYGTVGYARFQGTLGGRSHDFGMGVFRFRPDASAIEFLHQFNNNTWGLGFNAAGDVFGSTANNNPSFFGGIPAVLHPDGAAGLSAKMIADSPKFHPITPNIRQVDAFGAYTAGAGHAFATSDAFPPDYRDRIAFVNGPTGNLTGRFRIERDGAGYVARNAFAFAASADEWFSPVAAEVGPDGALWIADWYNFIIQHNPTPNPGRGGYQAQTGKGNAHINPNRDRERGRIYRVSWKDAPTPRTPESLAGATTSELANALDHDNQFWRLTAQRLLVQNRHHAAVPALKSKVMDGGAPAIHALWTLHGLDALDRETRQAALLSADPGLRRNAIKALGSGPDDLQLFFDTAVVKDADALVRLAAFNHLSRFPASDIVRGAIGQLLRDPENREDEWLLQSLRNAAAVHGVQIEYALGPNLLPNPSFEYLSDGMPSRWTIRTYSGSADHHVDRTVARSGKTSLRIRSEDGSDTSLFTRIAVEPESDYRLAAWIKSEGLRGARGAQMNVHGLPTNQGATREVTGTEPWTEVDVVIHSGARTTLEINALFGGWGRSRGTAWFDDVSFSKISYETAESAEPGDPERGLAIFQQHPIAACNRCHKIRDQGGVVGPPLDGIAARKTRDYLYESLVDPNRTIAEGYPLQASPMPPMGVLLNKQQLEDLMAYLMTLR